MTELKEITIALLFGAVFAAGFTIGIFSAIGIYYSSKRKKEIDQEEDKAIAEQSVLKSNDPYQELFDHMRIEHGLILLESEMDEIIIISSRIKKGS